MEKKSCAQAKAWHDADRLRQHENHRHPAEQSLCDQAPSESTQAVAAKRVSSPRKA